VLRVEGVAGGLPREFDIAVGKSAQSKFGFRAGDVVSGISEPVSDPRLETAEYFKTSALKVLERAVDRGESPPPWLGVAPALEEYRARGHRRLAVQAYEARCRNCRWGCRMPVELIIDQWSPSDRRYRFETFCYGPKSCPSYQPGPTRKVPGRRGMSWEEEDWVDEDMTAHREPDE
jgi:hypothetical protein